MLRSQSIIYSKLVKVQVSVSNTVAAHPVRKHSLLQMMRSIDSFKSAVPFEGETQPEIWAHGIQLRGDTFHVGQASRESQEMVRRVWLVI